MVEMTMRVSDALAPKLRRMNQWLSAGKLTGQNKYTRERLDNGDIMQRINLI